MIRVNDIQSAFINLVGWKQGYSSNNTIISDALTVSESGLYFQQAHPLITLDNISSLAPDFSNVMHAAYDKSKYYNRYDVVSYNTKLYIALLNSHGVEPGTLQSSQYWAETDQFSEWLREKTNSSIINAIVRFCTEKNVNGAPMLCENKTLFEGNDVVSTPVDNSNKLVGFELVSARAKGVTLKINKIGLSFTEPGAYTLYLMHTSSSNPIKEIKLVKSKYRSTEWFSQTDLFLPYVSDSTNAGGSWYLAYKQSELPQNSKAINKDFNFKSGPCQSCSRSQTLNWSAWSKYLEVHPFSIDENDANVAAEMSMWNTDDNQYDYSMTHGINLDVSVACDITDFIIENRTIFQSIIWKQLAIDMLRELAYNPSVRTNRNSLNISKMELLYEIDGDSTSLKKSGLKHEIDQLYKALKLSTDGIDRICMPCKNGGIKYRTV